MKDFQKNIHLYNNLNQNELGWGESRMVYEGVQKAPNEAPESIETPEAKTLVDLNKYEATANYDKDREKTLKELAQQDKVLQQNFELAITESLEKAGYDGNIDKFWKELNTDGCDKVQVENGRIRFLKGNVEVAPKFSSIPISPDLTKFRTDAPRTQYYNPETGLVSLKGWKETRGITIKDIILNEITGTQVEVTKRNNKKGRTATFDANGEAKYDDGRKEIVKIFDGDKVKLIRETAVSEDGPTATAPASAENISDKYPSLGTFKYIPKSDEKEGISARDYLEIALGINGKSDERVKITPNDDKVNRLRKLYTNSNDGLEKYMAFLKSKRAIREDNITLLIDTEAEKKQIEAGKRTELSSAQKAATKAEQTGQTAIERDALRQGPAMFLENRTIRSDKLKALVSNAKLFKKAWENPESMPEATALFQVLKTSPLCAKLSNGDPNFFRNQIREAIANGKENQLDIEDIVNFILKGTQLPSVAPLASPNNRPKNINFDDKLHPPKNIEKGAVEITKGFLSALGTEAVNSAQLLRYEDDDKIVVRFDFEGHTYAARLNYDHVLDSDSTLEILTPDGSKPFYEGFGYKNKTDIDNDLLLAHQDKEKTPKDKKQAKESIATIFKNMVTPRIGHELKYTDLVELYKQYYKENGQEKNPNKPGERIFKNLLQGIIIDSTLIMNASQNLSINQEVLAQEDRRERKIVSDYFGILHNNSVTNENKTFSKTMKDKSKFVEAWTRNQIEGKSSILKIIQQEPLFASLRNLPAPELAAKLHDTIYKGNKEGLDAEDIYDILLDKPLPGMRFYTGVIRTDDFKYMLNHFFDANGPIEKRIKEATPDEKKQIEYCRQFIQGASRLLRLFPTLNVAKNFVTETIDFNSSVLNNAGSKIALDQNAEKDPNKNTYFVYNIEDLIKNSHSPDLNDVGGQKAGTITGREAAGISIGYDITRKLNLPPNNTRAMLHALKYIFRTFSLQQLIDNGCVSKAHNSLNQEFYILNKTPLTQEQYSWLSKRMKTGSQISEEHLEVLNPQKRIEKVVNTVFPNTSTDSTYVDVVTGTQVTRQRGIERTMDMSFARSEFMRLDGIKENGSYNVNKTLKALQGYLNHGLLMALSTPKIASMDNSGFIFIENDIELAPADSEIADLIKQCKSPLTTEKFNKLLQNPKVLEAIRTGFEKFHNKKVKEDREKTIEAVKQQFESWKNTHPQEIANINSTLEDELKAKNYSAKEIERIKVEALPFFFYAGLGPEGAVIGGGANLAFDLGKGHTLYIGASLFTGTKTGVEAHAGYQSPKVGPVSFIIGGGGGVSAGTEVSFGYGVGVGMPIEVVRGRTNFTITPGLIYIPGLGLPAVTPGLTFTLSKGHEDRMNAAENKVLQMTGMDKIDAENTLMGKSNAILQNAAIFNQCKLYANNDRPTQQEALDAYEEIRSDLLKQIPDKYDPGWFDAITFGIGFNPDGKIIFGPGVSFYVGKDTLSTSKGSTDMKLENTLAMTQQLENKELTRSGINHYATIAENGQRIKVAGSEAEYTLGPAKISGSPARNPEKPINTSKALVEDINDNLRKANTHLELEYVPQMNMFKLNITDINADTNVVIAADHSMTSGGVYFDGVSTYITNSFVDQLRTLTIQRADFHTPKTLQDAHKLSVITISDNPLRSYADILNSAPELIEYKNGRPISKTFKQYTPRSESGITGKLYTQLQPLQSVFKKIDSAENTSSQVTNSEDYNKDRDALLLEESEKGKLEKTKLQYEAFVKQYLTQFPVQYRNWSNQESDGHETKRLTDHISKQFKKFFTTENNPNPNPTELNYIRNLLVRDTAVENTDRIKENDTLVEKARKAKLRESIFQRNLDSTRKTIEKRFKKAITSYNSKPENANHKISRTAEDLAEHIIRDLKQNRKAYDSFLGETTGKHISTTDSYEYVAGSMQQRGFRREDFQRDLTIENDPEMTILMAEEYSKDLNSGANNERADLAKIYLEELSPIPVLAETPSVSEARELINSPLGSKILVYLIDTSDAFALMLDNNVNIATKFRDAIAKIANTKNGIESLDDGQETALKRFEAIVKGIRETEYSGQKTFENPWNRDYTFNVKAFEVGDGAYNICTNYAPWFNEELILSVKGKEVPQYARVLAAHNASTDILQTEDQVRMQTLSAALAVAIKTKGGGGGGGGEEPEETEGSGDGKDDQKAGGETGGATKTPDAPQPETANPNGPDTAAPGSKISTTTTAPASASGGEGGIASGSGSSTGTGEASTNAKPAPATDNTGEPTY